jgi:hypothetical protein
MLWQRCYNQRQNLLVYRNFSLDAAEKYSPLTANMTDTLLYFIISRLCNFHQTRNYSQQMGDSPRDMLLRETRKSSR